MRDKHLYLMSHRLKHFIKFFVDKNFTSATALGTGWKNTELVGNKFILFRTSTLRSHCFTEFEQKDYRCPMKCPSN